MKQYFNINKTISCLNNNARPKSTGYCAKYIRLALNAGGFAIKPSGDAKNYGKILENLGFRVLIEWNGCGFSEDSINDYIPSKADIVVLQPYTGTNAAGHIAMYNGSCWVSDFKQIDMWGGKGYRNNKPPYVVYRWGVSHPGT